jgi:hypothetical protein
MNNKEDQIIFLPLEGLLWIEILGPALNSEIPRPSGNILSIHELAFPVS